MLCMTYEWNEYAKNSKNEMKLQIIIFEKSVDKNKPFHVYVRLRTIIYFYSFVFLRVFDDIQRSKLFLLFCFFTKPRSRWQRTIRRPPPAPSCSGSATRSSREFFGHFCFSFPRLVCCKTYTFALPDALFFTATD